MPNAYHYHAPPDRKVVVEEEVTLECFVRSHQPMEPLSNSDAAAAAASTTTTAAPPTGDEQDRANYLDNRYAAGNCRWSHYDVQVNNTASGVGEDKVKGYKRLVTRYKLVGHILQFRVKDAKDTGIYLCTCGSIIRSRHDIVGQIILVYIYIIQTEYFENITYIRY